MKKTKPDSIAEGHSTVKPRPVSRGRIRPGDKGLAILRASRHPRSHAPLDGEQAGASGLPVAGTPGTADQ